jgi:alkanesulfonate monooxygenase SsuD/methylene tetrahydromethanopterin reductase-like flavin-dependent oxidoreductase (luciferase family)
MSRLRLGVCLPQFTADAGAVLGAAAEAEADGYDVVSLFDHLTPLGGPPSRPILECLTTLTAVAAVTERVELLPLVLRASLRPPVTLAAILRTIALAAPGRVVCGLGGGDRFNAGEDHSVGLPVLGPQQRTAAVVAAVAAVRDGAPGVPVWLGGSGPAMARLAGAAADGWNIWGAPPALLAERAAAVAAAAQEAGRPTPVISWGGQVVVGRDDDAAERRLREWGAGRTPGQLAGVVHGGPARVAERLGVLAGAGASAFLLSFVGAGAGAARRLFAREAAPILRTGES